eukprot:gene4638-4891_t
MLWARSRKQEVVYFCPKSGNAAQGFVIVQPLQNNYSKPGAGQYHQRVYRIRLLGAEVLVPAVHYCGDVAVSQYQCTMPGEFHTAGDSASYMSACAAAQPFGKKVCFIGDSQTRHLYNLVTLSLDARMAAGFVADSGTPDKTPIAPEVYAAKVQAVADHMAAERSRHHNAMFWTTVNTFPLLKDFFQLGTHNGSAPRQEDFRTEPYLLLYNKVASSIMHRSNIPVVDTFHIGDPDSELS